jgi:hypothetical protein
MINIQGPGSLKKISGKSCNYIGRIPDILFARKHLTSPKEEKNIQKTKNLFAFVSSPKIYKDKRILSKVCGWCHSFRDPDIFLPKSIPKILLPESDFIDPMFVACNKKENTVYDFFYFTINSQDGIRHKGLDIFCKCLDILCCKHKLRGVVIVYFPNVAKIKKFRITNNEQNNVIHRNSKYLTFLWGKLSNEKMSELCSRCKFGFFPNRIDNSPRIIAESLVRDIPVMIFDQIHGGWHYVSENSGCIFNIENLNEKIEYILNNKFYPREWYLNNFGFEKSSRKLANFVQSLVKLDNVYSHMYFNNFEKYLRKIK